VFSLTTRDQIAYVLASAGTAVSAGFSWFLNSPLLGVATGILLGALVTDFTQSRGQKRAIRRELALQNVSTIYGPLYKELLQIQYTGMHFSYLRGYEDFDIQQWSRVSTEFYIHFVSPDLRPQLESFYSLVLKFNGLIPIVNEKVGQVIAKDGSKFYGFDILALMYGAIVNGADVGTIVLDNLILFGIPPRKVLEAKSPNPTMQYYVRYSARKSIGHAPYSNDLRDPKELDRFDELYSTLVEDVKSNSVVQELRKTLEAILNTCPIVRVAVLRMIQEPWSV
jgi:hypothetical protein